MQNSCLHLRQPYLLEGAYPSAAASSAPLRRLPKGRSGKATLHEKQAGGESSVTLINLESAQILT